VLSDKRGLRGIMKKFLPLLLCSLVSIFGAAHTLARHVMSDQNNPTAQKAETKPLLSDQTNDQDVSSDDEDNVGGASGNEDESVTDDGSDAPADQDAGDNAAGDDDGSDESPDDQGK
jgi:hypothetical protein